MYMHTRTHIYKHIYIYIYACNRRYTIAACQSSNLLRPLATFVTVCRCVQVGRLEIQKSAGKVAALRSGHEFPRRRCIAGRFNVAFIRRLMPATIGGSKQTRLACSSRCTESRGQDPARDKESPARRQFPRSIARSENLIRPLEAPPRQRLDCDFGVHADGKIDPANEKQWTRPLSCYLPPRLPRSPISSST